MTKAEKRAFLLNEIFDEEKRRTEVEKKAEELHIAGKPQEAVELLNNLDDSILLGLREKLKRLDETPEDQAKNRSRANRQQKPRE